MESQVGRENNSQCADFEQFGGEGLGFRSFFLFLRRDGQSLRYRTWYKNGVHAFRALAGDLSIGNSKSRVTCNQALIERELFCSGDEPGELAKNSAARDSFLMQYCLIEARLV